MSLLDPPRRYSATLETRFGCPGNEFQVVDNWAQRPRGWSLGDVTGVAVDSRDHVFVLTRTSRPVIEFDEEGRFVTWWGDSLFANPHGIAIGPDDAIYCTDIGDHTVKKFSRDGELLLVLGNRFQCAPRLSGKPFNMPTHATASVDGDIFVTDGYGNASVHVFSSSGEHKLTFGSPGSGPGEFRSPHSIVIHEGRLFVVDRANNRVQVFTAAGELVGQMAGLRQPNDIVIRKNVAYICELEHRLSIWDLDGNQLASWGDEGESLDAGYFVAPHCLAVDSRGSLFVGEVSDSFCGIDRGLRTLQKFIRVN